MAFASGTVKSINEFVDAMAVLAVANSWVILDGSENQSDSGVFPINSRYIRFDFRDPPGAGLMLAEIDFRATAGGADIAVTSSNIQRYSGDVSPNTHDHIVDGTGSVWEMSPTTNAYIEFNFGSAQTIREFVFTSPTVGSRAPSTIVVSRSEDGVYWDPVWTWNALSFSSNEAKVLTLPADLTPFATSTATGGVRRPCQYWLQGPGYDAARRVYVGFELFQDFDGGNQGFRMQGATDFTLSNVFDDQLQAIPAADAPFFVIDNTPESIDYWLYVNSTRITAVLRAGAGDYAMFYAGFVAAFANPDQHTNPLYIAGSSPNIGSGENPNFRDWNEAHTQNSTPWDPGDRGGWLLDYKGDWIAVNNNQNTTALGRYPLNPVPAGEFFISPFHFGPANGGSTINASYSLVGGDGDINGDHFLKNVVATLQDEIPIFDCLVQSLNYGQIGALQGVVAIPGQGGLTPEGVVTLGLQNYRVFPKRTLRDEAQWIAIEEV